MSESFDNVIEGFVVQVGDMHPAHEGTTNAIKNLKTLAEARNLMQPELEPEPEPTGIRGFIRRNGGDLIKTATTFGVVAIIAGIEAKGDVIFRSKASKFI